MKLKNLLTFGIAAVITVSAAVSTFAASININGKLLKSDTEPQIIEGRTMVPVRAIFEGVGAKVTWDADTKTVTGKMGNNTVTMTSGEKAMTVNGKKVNMDGALMIIDSRAYAPARYVAEAFGYDVSWNADTKEVVIADKTESPSALTTEKKTETTTSEPTTKKAAEEKTTKAEEKTTKAEEKTTKNTAEEKTTKKANEEKTTKTTKETSTETTTLSARDILNKSPVTDVSKKVYDMVKNDIKTAFSGYFVGNASGNGRFSRPTYNKLFDMWDSTATTDTEKKYVAQSKIVYQNMVTTCTRIDQRKSKHPSSSSVGTYCQQRKDKLSNLIDKYFKSTNIDEATKTAEEIKKFASATLNK